MTSKKRLVTIGILFIMIVGALPLLTPGYTEGVTSAVLPVGGTGPGNYTQLQEAINDAHAGDTILVYDGVYHENVDVDTSVLILSKNGPAACSVQAPNPNDHVFEVTGDHVTIQGFTLTDAQGELKAGIYLAGVDQCTISGNIISSNNLGIFLDSSHNNALTTNTVNGNSAYGIFLESSTGTTLTSNTLSNNYYGICLESSTDNTLTNNSAQSNIWIGISLESSPHNTLTSNTVSNTLYDGYGISLTSSPGNILTGNTVTSSGRSGILLESSSNNTLTTNTLSNSSTYGIYLESSSGNIIYHNNFINNPIHAMLSGGANTWDNGSLSGGNYWDDYTGGDTTGDLIGDTPYSIQGVTNKDRYPLMRPYQMMPNRPPVCALSAAPTRGTVPLTLTFTMTASDPDGTIATWTLDINNDGAAEYSGSGTPPSTRQYTYTTLGIYTANLTVTDAQGATASDTQSITVSQTVPDNQPPAARFEYTPSSPVPLNTSLTFRDKSTDADGGVVEWMWDFGDESTGTGKQVTHTYRKGGSYTVTLTVTDNDGATGSSSLVITVNTGDKTNGDSGIPGFGFLSLLVSLLGLFFLVQRKKHRG